jgi:hypothetical protein
MESALARSCRSGIRGLSRQLLLEAFYGKLELLNPAEEALGDFAGNFRDLYAFLAVEAGGGAAFEGIFELPAAGAAGAEACRGLGLWHVIKISVIASAIRNRGWRW